MNTEIHFITQQDRCLQIKEMQIPYSQMVVTIKFWELIHNLTIDHILDYIRRFAHLIIILCLGNSMK